MIEGLILCISLVDNKKVTSGYFSSTEMCANTSGFCKHICFSGAVSSILFV